MKALVKIAGLTQADLEDHTLYFSFDSRRERIWVFYDVDPDYDRPRAIVLSIRDLEDDE